MPASVMGVAWELMSVKASYTVRSVFGVAVQLPWDAS